VESIGKEKSANPTQEIPTTMSELFKNIKQLKKDLANY